METLIYSEMSNEYKQLSVINTNVCYQIQLLQKNIKLLWNIAAHIKLGAQRLLSIKNYIVFSTL
jgi:hypothetical protein